MSESNKAGLEKIEELLNETSKSNAEVLKGVKEIKKYMRWQNIWSSLRFFLIAVPLILGFIYLPPLIKDALQYYKSLLLN